MKYLALAAALAVILSASPAHAGGCAIFKAATHQCTMTDEELNALGPTHPIDEHKRLVTAWHVLNAQCEKTGEVDDGPYSPFAKIAE